jgi:hypothetical protein
MIMGIELFGATHAVYLAVACFMAYLCSGHSSIYLAQRIGVPKTSADELPRDIALRHLRDFLASSHAVRAADRPASERSQEKSEAEVSSGGQ